MKQMLKEDGVKKTAEELFARYEVLRQCENDI